MFLILILLLFGGPRLISIFWYLLDQARWAATFDSILLPILGFLFLPWTLVMYVLVGPTVDGGEWLLVGLGLLADALSWGSGARETRRYGFKTTA